MKLAITHDFLNQFGGAERVVAALNELYPEAPIFTSIYTEKTLPEIFQRMDIRTSFLQQIPGIDRFFKLFFWLYPIAFERFDLADYEVVLSSSSAFAKGVKKSPKQLHLCYCYTPMRFVWRYDDYVKREGFPWWVKEMLPFFLEPIRTWDLANIQNVDHFIAISDFVAARIKQIYGREAKVIYPPVETDAFQPSAIDRDYFLVVSRLNPYKRLDIVVEAFNELDLPLKIIGSGPDRPALERKARPNIEFLGRLSDAETARYLAESRGLIFPGEEDFGIVPLEAMAAGRPVIAYNGGGARETVVDGLTGLFFNEQTPASLIQAVKRFRFELFDKNKIREQALKFDKKIFKQKISAYVQEKYEQKFS